jgi:hypothetical protein
VHLVDHDVAGHELAAGGMPGEDDYLEVRKNVFARELAQDFIGEVIRSQRFVVRRRAADAPAAGADARPVHLARSEAVFARFAIVGRESAAR